MIATTMAVAVAGERRLGRGEQAHQARFPRLVALILDTIFVSILSGIATAVYGVTAVSGTWHPNGVTYWNAQTTLPAIWTAAIWIGYYTVCEAMFSATPGKALNGLRVVSVDDRPLTLQSILLRNLLRLIDVLPGMYLVGGVLVMGSQYSQRLGDRTGHTTVVLRRDALQPGATRTSDWKGGLALVAMVLVTCAFTAAFDYFGRPPLEIQTLYQEHQLLDGPIISYSLGTPTWSWARVRYPITVREPGPKTCTGHIDLDWYGIMGWQPAGGELSCPPS